ncbi:MAG: InlB B-repeat-containing protein [Bacteroidaceae bacterium]|nr:InlB B-repeat-containing protein [Bacteroidaceae bacterium]
MKRILFIISVFLISVGAWSQASITLESLPESAAGNMTLSLGMMNEENIKGFQCDITLPSFVKFNDSQPQTVGNASDFEVAYKLLSEQVMRIVVTSATNFKIIPDSVNIVEISVEVADATGDTDETMKVSNASAVLEGYKMINIPDGEYTVFAKKPVFVVSYMDEGEEVHRDTLAQGVEIVPPALTLEKEGHTFVGWDSLPEIMPDSDIVVNSVYEKNKYEVVFMVDGEVFRTDSILYGTEFELPVMSEKDGYTFDDWGGLQVEYMPPYDLTIEGWYILNEIQYDDQGLIYKLCHPDSVNYDSIVFALAGYTDSLLADIAIAEEIHSVPVTVVADSALYGAEVLKSVVMPESIAGVGNAVFEGCANLLEVEWNSEDSIRAECFDTPENHGNMLVWNHSNNDNTTFEGNVIFGDAIESLALVDGLPFRSSHDFIAERVEYSRLFSKQTHVGVPGGWEAVILPFSVQTIVSEDGSMIAPFGVADMVNSLPCWLADMNTNGAFSYVQAIAANTPFIIRMPNSDDYEEEFNIEGRVTFVAEGATVKATTGLTGIAGDDFSLCGTYEGEASGVQTYAVNDEAYVSDEGDEYLPGSVFVSDSRDVRPFEAYAYSVQAGGAKFFNPWKDTSTGIDGITTKADKDGEDVWYTLQGIRLKGKPADKGLYIHNGKVVRI